MTSLRTWPRAFALMLLLLSAACGDDASSPPADSSTPELDGSMMDDAEAGSPEDADVPDTGTPPNDAAMDAGGDGDGDGDGDEDGGADAAGPDVVEAVLGVRCALDERIGLIEVISWGEAFEPTVSGTIYDRPNAAIGEPVLSDEACDFHRAPSGAGCSACDDGEVCGAQSTCEPAQQPLTDVLVSVTKGASAQEIAVDELTGAIYGNAELARPFGLELQLADQTVVMGESDFPSGLTNGRGTLTGDYDNPEAADITWSGASQGHVFTRVPINHHVGGPTFTECVVDAADGEMHIDGAMLVELAVVTGLEFQGIEHVFFAAAETDAGCVELRYTVQHSVSLLAP